MTTESQEPGGIRAKRIQADNVVSGVQFQRGDSAQAAALVQLAQAIKRGDITADDITARNVVSGLQYIADPATASTEELRKELLAFQTKLDQAIAAQELPSPDDAQDAKDSLNAAQTELAKPQPSGERVLRKLDEVSTIVTKSAEIAQASGKIGAYVVQLAPVAAVLWQVAQRLFGL
jgi:dsDNA-specific endonuclease/ATPase MutS2